VANNRMWLIHKPSGIGVMIGKRLAIGWHHAPKKDKLQSFYSYICDYYPESQDDFVLAMEDCTGSTCYNDWKYSSDPIIEGGFRRFEMGEDVNSYTPSPIPASSFQADYLIAQSIHAPRTGWLLRAL